MRSICFFSSYSTSADIPNYIQYYLKELTRHFTKVIFTTNERILKDSSLSFLKSNNIELFLVENQGYDFGMWHKGMLKYNAEEYDRVGLVNDSCILFKPLDDYFIWLDKQNLDYAGMIDSNEITYHIQSFFLTLNKNAIAPVLHYFKKNGYQAGREETILIYELGLCQYIQKEGLQVGSWFSCEKYLRNLNPSLYAVDKIIDEGYPLIKKKIIFNSFSNEEYKEIVKHWFHHNPNFYFSIIKKSNRSNILFDLNLLRADGYNPDLNKIRRLRLTSIRYRTRQFVLSRLKTIYNAFKIRDIRDQFEYRIQKIKNKFSIKTKNKEAKIGICLFCKDENQYLQEWLNHHRSLGFTHFFIYDNNSKTPISQTLENQNDCTVTIWQDNNPGKQMNAYFDCCQKNKNYDWILFVDTDEFLILKKHKTVQGFLNEYTYFDAVGINWICYSGSGHENRVEWFNYTKYIPLSNDINKHIKSFVRPSAVKNIPKDPHKFSIVTVNENKKLIDGPLFKHSSDIAFIRHNVTRSKNEYRDKITRGRGDGAPSPHTLETFYHFEEQATETDE